LTFLINNLKQLGSGNLGLEVTIPGNTILDAALVAAETKLRNFTSIQLPPFKFTNPLLSVSIPTSYVEGLQSFHRVGDTLITMSPLSTNGIAFGVGWTQIRALLNLELYYLQPFGLYKADKGTLTLTFSNITSQQTFTYDRRTAFLLVLEDLVLGLGQGTVTIDGFGTTGSTVGQVLTSYIKQNKDLKLNVLSFIMKEFTNACLTGIRTVIFLN
jgi:hypothetical protein